MKEFFSSIHIFTSAELYTRNLLRLQRCTQETSSYLAFFSLSVSIVQYSEDWQYRLGTRRGQTSEMGVPLSLTDQLFADSFPLFHVFPNSWQFLALINIQLLIFSTTTDSFTATVIFFFFVAHSYQSFQIVATTFSVFLIFDFC